MAMRPIADPPRPVQVVAPDVGLRMTRGEHVTVVSGDLRIVMWPSNGRWEAALCRGDAPIAWMHSPRLIPSCSEDGGLDIRAEEGWVLSLPAGAEVQE